MLFLRTRENITKFCPTCEINLIFNKTVNILYLVAYLNLVDSFKELMIFAHILQTLSQGCCI